MKHLSDFYILKSDLEKGVKELQEDGSTKYTFDDSGYIIEHPKDDESYSHYRKFTKYETDGTRKEYEENLNRWEGTSVTVHTLPSLEEVINPDGSKREISLSYRHFDDCPYASLIAIVDTEKDIKEKYSIAREFDYTLQRYVGDDYCLTEKMANCISREIRHVEESGYLSERRLPSRLRSMIDPQRKEDRPLVYEITKGARREYIVDNLEIAEKMLAFDGELPQEYKKFLVSEELNDGTEHKWENGYITYEKIPNVVERTWENGVLIQEVFGEGTLQETISYEGADPKKVAEYRSIIAEYEQEGDYKKSEAFRQALEKELRRDELVTSDTLADGTVRTFYDGKLISENRPDFTYHVVTASQDEQGVWHTTYPDGTPMLEWQSENDYKKWASNGNIKEKCVSGFRRYFDPEREDYLIACEGFGGLYGSQRYGTSRVMFQEFKEAIESGNMKAAKNYLVVMCRALEGSCTSHSGYDGISMVVRNSLDHTQIKVLDNGLVAFGAIFEDRHFTKESFRGGIEWYWRGVGLLLDPEKGNVVAQCYTDRINVRDRYDPNLDKWKYIDTEDFMDFKDGKLSVRLGGYTSSSVDVDFDKYAEIVASIEKDIRISKGMAKFKEYMDSKTPSSPVIMPKTGGRGDGK